MKIDLGAQGSSCSCVWRAIRCRRLTSSIRVFHLGVSLGSFDYRPNCPHRDSQDFGIRMISNHINPGISEITVQTDNRKTPRVRLRGSQPWFSIPSPVVRHQIPLLSQADARHQIPFLSQAVARHELPPSREPLSSTKYPLFAKGDWGDFSRPIPPNFNPPSVAVSNPSVKGEEQSATQAIN